MTDLFNLTEEPDLEGYNLLIASVSIGNVPQLTVDLFITTFRMLKISTVWHKAIVPCVSSDPYYNTKELCTACELFINKDLKIAVLQLRSSLESKHSLMYFKQLKIEVAKIKFNRIIILTSIFDYELHNVKSIPFFYASEDICLEGFQKLNKDSAGKYYLNGGGFAAKLYEIFNSPQVLIIGKYVSEGDNRPDAYSMFKKILPLLEVKENLKIKEPSSWKYVFGGPPPIGIF